MDCSDWSLILRSRGSALLRKVRSSTPERSFIPSSRLISVQSLSGRRRWSFWVSHFDIWRIGPSNDRRSRSFFESSAQADCAPISSAKGSPRTTRAGDINLAGPHAKRAYDHPNATDCCGEGESIRKAELRTARVVFIGDSQQSGSRRHEPFFFPSRAFQINSHDGRYQKFSRAIRAC